MEKKTIFEWLSLADDSLWNFTDSAACRASGPGGQKVNKTSSALQIHFSPLNLSIKSQKHRSQSENKKSALRLLREEISLFAEPPVPQLALEATLPYFKNGLHIQGHNPLLPMLYAVLCARFLENQGEHKLVAEALGVSTSRLVRFMAENKKLLERVNQLRQKFSKNSLHG